MSVTQCEFFLYRDEEILVKGLELNDSLQSVLARHDAIASGSPLPPQLTLPTPATSVKHESNLRSSEVSTPPAAANETPPAPASTVVDEEDDEEDDFAQLARRFAQFFFHSYMAYRSFSNSSDLF